MEHIVRFFAGYDCKHFECKFGSERCKPGSNHGVSGLRIIFASKGEEGAVTFALQTGWLPQQVEPDSLKYYQCTWQEADFYPADLGYHSKTPRWEDQEPMKNCCEFCDGMPCYYDGSGLNAADAMYALVNGGDVALWEFLDAYYQTIFHDKPYPKPAEYPANRRQSNEIQ